MPRPVDPGTLAAGSGSSVPATSPNFALGGTGMGGNPPNTGAPAHIDSTGANDTGFPEPPPDKAFNVAQALGLHVHNPMAAHSASAIALDPAITSLTDRNVELGLADLSSMIPPPVPPVGGVVNYLTVNGIPDWGPLKLSEGAGPNNIPTAALYVNSQDQQGSSIYPLYTMAATPTMDWDFTTNGPGYDPTPDLIWNNFPDSWGVSPGEMFSGGYTNGVVAGSPIVRTHMMPGGTATTTLFAISGVVSPADRGVLALIHWPSGGQVSDFLAQSLTDRCYAALLLGQGVGDYCIYTVSDAMKSVDGEPGGIWHASTASGSFNPYTFPGRATGQYNLREIETGVSDVDGTTLPSPFNTPWQRSANSPSAGAGQVRLGTDPNAGITPVEFGIPILGASAAGYNPQASLPTTTLNSQTVSYWGHTVFPETVAAAASGTSTSVGPGFLTENAAGWTAHAFQNMILKDSAGVHWLISDNNSTTINLVATTATPAAGAFTVTLPSYNFFAYRLPYLADYSAATGLKYTPRASNNPYLAGPAARYFIPHTPFSNIATGLSANTNAPGGYLLKQAGNYQNLPEDYWNAQVARYRQVFWLSSSTGTSMGSFWLIHFKTEANFESFVRDGIMPWDATSGYSTYSISMVDGNHADAHAVTATANIVNESSSAVPSNYGFGAQSYHTIRREVFRANTTTLPSSVTSTYDYTLLGTTPSVMWMSGVAYFIPLQVGGASDGQSAFEISALNVSASNLWPAGYRVDDNPLASGATNPAKVSSKNCPAMMSLAAFTYEGADTLQYNNWASSSGLTYALPSGLTDSRGARSQRVEFPLAYCGTNGSGVFSDANGPLSTDTLTLGTQVTGGAVSTTHPITLQGDINNPVVMDGATPWLYLRHLDLNFVIIPSDGQGYRVVNNHAADSTNGYSVLFHSTGFHVGGGTGVGAFGNFISGGVMYSSLFTAQKDYWERFLDETYRYYFTGVTSTAGTTQGALIGPGMNGWGSGPIPIPTQAGTAAAPYSSWSWGRQSAFTSSLTSTLTDSLQVAGQQQRNPLSNDWLTAPFASSGLLLYPSEDFSTSHHPTNTELSTLPGPPTQPNYSAATGDRTFYRVFDANFSRSTDPNNPATQQQGQQFFILRVDGLDLTDFAYAAPGPGGLSKTGIAIHVKVPGLTTWMDLGRLDGDGPSKQDAALDGAGCQVAGPYTYTYFDTSTGLVYSQVQVNVGNAASLALGLSNEVPVMVRVTMRPGNLGGNGTITNYNLMYQKTGVAQWSGPTFKRTWASTTIRGLCGMRLVHPNNWTQLNTTMIAAKTAMGITY